MNYSGMNDWRARRNLLNNHLNGSNQNFSTRHYSIFNYSTEEKSKSDLKNTLGNDMFISNLHMIKDPLKKNLADTLVTEDIKPKTKMVPQTDYDSDQTNQNNHRDFYTSLAGIGNFISGVFNVISGAMFHKRARSPVTQYYDCFDNSFVHEESPALETWQPSKCEVENKNGRANEQFNSSTDNGNTDVKPSIMTSECRTVAGHCESKINQVRLLLSNKASSTPPKLRRRPRRKFVEPGLVEETFEDAFSPEDFEKLANELYIQCVSPYHCQNQELVEADAPIMRTEFAPVHEEMDIVKSIEEIKEKVNLDHSKTTDMLPRQTGIEDKQEIVIKDTVVIDKVDSKDIISNCEDKVSRLKALLLERCKKNTKTIINCLDSAMESAKVDERVRKPSKPVPTPKIQDKHYKNPHRLSTGKRNKSQMRRDIQEDMMFANEIDCEEVPIENSPSVMNSIKSQLSNSASSTEDLEDNDYFNEVTGRFHSTSTIESDDSFQIVFNDSPPIPRQRKISDCDSEDSFIVFEDSPDSCYTSNDVFGDDVTDMDSCDSDTDSDISDSGCGSSKLTHSMTRTFGDLTDDSLYEEIKSSKCGSEDEVDCTVGVPCEETSADQVVENDDLGMKSNGLLLDEAKKKIKKQPPKKVHFSPLPPKVHVMRVWAFAARQARMGNWERVILDRDRFKRRIADVDMAISWVLKPQHRTRIMFQRFMPWWNAQRRKELAEKKQREEEARMKAEEVRNVDTASDSVEKVETVLNSISKVDVAKVNIDTNKCTERLGNCSDESYDKNRVCTKNDEK